MILKTDAEASELSEKPLHVTVILFSLKIQGSWGRTRFWGPQNDQNLTQNLGFGPHKRV